MRQHHFFDDNLPPQKNNDMTRRQNDNLSRKQSDDKNRKQSDDITRKLSDDKNRKRSENLTRRRSSGMTHKQIEDFSRNDLLIVFVREPVPGRVKTRLAADIGDENAAAVYLELLRVTRLAAEPLEAAVRVWFDRLPADDSVWDDARYEKRIQPDGDLGVRLQAAFRDGFDSCFDRIVAIGSDCPDVTTGHLRKAFEMLGKFDIVIGPAGDGGYYLIGLSSPAPWLFTKMPWSEPTLLGQALSRIRQRKQTSGLLSKLNDIDTLEDLQTSSLSGYINRLDTQ